MFLGKLISQRPLAGCLDMQGKLPVWALMPIVESGGIRHGRQPIRWPEDVSFNNTWAVTDQTGLRFSLIDARNEPGKVSVANLEGWDDTHGNSPEA